MYQPNINKDIIESIKSLEFIHLSRVEIDSVLILPHIYEEFEEIPFEKPDSRYDFQYKGKERRVEASVIFYDTIDKLLSSYAGYSDYVGILVSEPITQPIEEKREDRYVFYYPGVFGQSFLGKGVIVSTYGLTNEQVIKVWKHEWAHQVIDIYPHSGIINHHCTNMDCLFKPLYDTGDVDTASDFCEKCKETLSPFIF